jgi:hypothetical protein
MCFESEESWFRPVPELQIAFPSFLLSAQIQIQEEKR